MGKTITAIATPAGTGAVSLIRISGPEAIAIAKRAIGEGAIPACRSVGLRKIRDEHGRVLDEGVLLAFQGPKSYTGEDVIEFTGHSRLSSPLLTLNSSTRLRASSDVKRSPF